MKIIVKQTVVNAALIALIVVVTLAVLIFSFGAKAIRYDETAGVIPLQVHKKEYRVSALTIGTVNSVKVSPGQHIKKGDEIASITNGVLDKQIALLQELSKTNGSASIELVNLLTQKEAQRMYAPTDGVVATVITEGQPVNTLENIATIYSDAAVELTGSFSLNDYNVLQRGSGSYSLENERLRSNFRVNYIGTRQLVETKNNPGANITLAFALVNPEDASTLLQNEQVKLRLTSSQRSDKPIDRFLYWYQQTFLNR